MSKQPDWNAIALAADKAKIALAEQATARQRQQDAFEMEVDALFSTALEALPDKVSRALMGGRDRVVVYAYNTGMTYCAQAKETFERLARYLADQEITCVRQSGLEGSYNTGHELYASVVDLVSAARRLSK